MNTGCVLFKEGQYEAARQKFVDAISVVGYQVSMMCMLAWLLMVAGHAWSGTHRCDHACPQNAARRDTLGRVQGRHGM